MKVIIDTDIGTDIDDAFALALALQCPELELLGFSTTSGDTRARARIVDRLLYETGRSGLPVAAGSPTSLPFNLPPIGRQERFGSRHHRDDATRPSAVDFIAGQIERHPGQVTLVAIGPLTNVAALATEHPDTFRKLGRLVMMGGAFGPVDMGGLGIAVATAPEYNILGDVDAARTLFRTGVPIHMVSYDATARLKLDEVRREQLLSAGSPLTDALGILYLMSNRVTPVLFDAMAVAHVVDPALCPTRPAHVVVDEHGITRISGGQANVQVCLQSDPDAFFRFFMARFQQEHQEAAVVH